ncbi:signal recognition particle-docking protein FtsY [Arsukibacterium sp.]|uniref:signal recognition particle-docking protein FtsY n=1 Tax=Arsukibacterium sp. TaxID=1977258 RepID=UPI00299EAAEC|nr:signal recognition particle-docking protein FtsY [Arsukibacterium sp.]MDX1676684.1 signal recognition particle-docking protein FtsY [Arsukibacterium sp.]
MTKQKNLFSWLGLGKKTAAPEAEQARQADAQRKEPENTQDDAAAAKNNRQPMVTETPALSEKNQTEKPDTAVTADKTAKAAVTAVPVDAVSQSASAVQPVTLTPAKKTGFFTRLKQGLAKTSQNLGDGLAGLFVGKKIDDELYEELETQLLMADVGMDTTQKLISQLTQHANRKALKDAGLLFNQLQQDMAAILARVEQPLIASNPAGPFVILMVGVNGVGKTTTIGKMAQQFRQQGKSVMLAAGDTFRAAAVEQLQVWGERNAIPVIAQHTGADSASVIFDAYQAAKARKVDILIADTAGRLQNKAHLMEELKKIVRVLQKIDSAAPHEVMLTLDAGTGQNALSQAKLFNDAVPLTGITLTKLDGTAKGGVIFAIADQFAVPIRYIGVGEAIDDLRQFQSQEFIKALFSKDH